MKTFSEALLASISNNGPSLLAISKATGVSYEQLKKLKQSKSKSTNVEDAIKIAGYFGKTVEEFMGLEDPHVAAGHLQGLIDQLSDQERAIFSTSIKAILDARTAQPEPAPDE